MVLPISFAAVRLLNLWFAFALSCIPYYWWLDYQGGKVVVLERKSVSRQLEWCIDGIEDRIRLWSL
jgi:hypothetical protein